MIVSHFFGSTVQNLFRIYFSGSTSPCEDKVVSGLAATYKGELWFKNDIWVSFDACSPDNIQNNSKLSTNFLRNKWVSSKRGGFKKQGGCKIYPTRSAGWVGGIFNLVLHEIYWVG